MKYNFPVHNCRLNKFICDFFFNYVISPPKKENLSQLPALWISTSPPMRRSIQSANWTSCLCRFCFSVSKVSKVSNQLFHFQECQKKVFETNRTAGRLRTAFHEGLLAWINSIHRCCHEDPSRRWKEFVGTCAYIGIHTSEKEAKTSTRLFESSREL